MFYVDCRHLKDKRLLVWNGQPLHYLCNLTGMYTSFMALMFFEYSIIGELLWFRAELAAITIRKPLSSHRIKEWGPSPISCRRGLVGAPQLFCCDLHEFRLRFLLTRQMKSSCSYPKILVSMNYYTKSLHQLISHVLCKNQPSCPFNTRL